MKWERFATFERADGAARVLPGDRSTSTGPYRLLPLSPNGAVVQFGTLLPAARFGPSAFFLTLLEILFFVK